MNCELCSAPGVVEAVNLVDYNLCHTCMFWLRVLLSTPPENSVRVGGIHYTIHPDNMTGMRGFGGRHFRIIFRDGRTVDTKNLFHQGEIPEKFKTRLADNAEFIS